MRKVIDTMLTSRGNARYNKSLFTLLFIAILLFSIATTAQGAQIEIDVASEVYSEETFEVSVYDPDIDITTGSPYLNEVTIGFNGATYEIDVYSDSVSIQAPSVTGDTEYTISASKTGYTNAETTITVSKKLSLIVSPEKQTVEKGELFAVRVRDQDGKTVQGATIAIQSSGSSKKTDSDGMEWLTAPNDNREKIKIIANKTGYEQGEATVGVTPELPLIERILQSPYTPILIAAALLIIAAFIVNLRQKKNIDNRAKEISKEKVLNKYSPQPHGAIISSAGTKEETWNAKGMPNKPGPKVEEIRISRPRKDKEIFSVNGEKREDERKVMPMQSKSKSDWFEGKDSIKYEIDKMTGDVDEEELDKWFEGTSDIQDKIDERVRKKDKKKKEQEENN